MFQSKLLKNTWFFISSKEDNLLLGYEGMIMLINTKKKSNFTSFKSNFKIKSDDFGEKLVGNIGWDYEITNHYWILGHINTLVIIENNSFLDLDWKGGYPASISKTRHP